MELKGRLKLIYDMIPACKILCDVGTDHALVPAYALVNHRCERAIASDIKKGPLERAMRTVKKYNLADRVELRIGNGLEPFSPDETDVVVIAGMGGMMIREIIMGQFEKASQAKCLILQPMHAQEIVRPFLWSQGFSILDEALVREGDKLYQVITAAYTGVNREMESCDSIHAVIGEKLIEKQDRLLVDWIADRLKRQRKIVQGMRAATDESEALVRETLLMEKMEALQKELGF